jgi:hypothetical protein
MYYIMKKFFYYLILRSIRHRASTTLQKKSWKVYDEKLKSFMKQSLNKEPVIPPVVNFKITMDNNLYILIDYYHIKDSISKMSLTL